MKDRDLRIGFIGGGNMAQAIVAGLLNAGHDPKRLMIADPSELSRARILELNSDIVTSSDNAQTADFAELLVLAVKPQIMAEVVADLTGNAHVNPPIVSIAAGITLQRLEAWFGTRSPIVRVMPNQPALVGAGMSVLIANRSCTDTHREQAEYITRAVGRSAWIEKESLMDAVTAVSGSGPAYFYLLMEVITACAHDMGIPDDLARTLARQTAYGAGLTALQSELSISDLRQNVTSPGGTTAAALEVLERQGFRDMLAEALEAARKRSEELGAN